jgi:D-serine deaminase-like pyridoxal phosphate-dependent protein
MHPTARVPGDGERACGLDEIPTPALVIDGGIARRNVLRLADYCRTHDLALRPHTKTHKSVFIAGLQLDAGAAGITVAKAGEAEALLPAFAGRGVPDILVAYPPVDPARSARIAALAREATVRVALDTPFAATGLAAAARAAGSTVGVLVDLDVGMGRTGVADPAALERLAEEVTRLPGLRLDGILCYPGHVLAPVADQAGPLAAVGALLAEAIRRFDRAGLCREIVSGGSTPTAFTSHLVGSLTEIRPGTSVFNDMNTVRGGFCGLEDCAATILCTVVSDCVPGQIVLDGGSKTFTSDRCGPAPDSGHGHVLGHPGAVVAKLTEEHGQVDVRACAARPRVGDRVRVVPNHVCPCVNLQDHIWWLEDGAARPLPVDARGRLS